MEHKGVKKPLTRLLKILGVKCSGIHQMQQIRLFALIQNLQIENRLNIVAIYSIITTCFTVFLYNLI